jgi:hypothetical protein
MKSLEDSDHDYRNEGSELHIVALMRGKITLLSPESRISRTGMALHLKQGSTVRRVHLKPRYKEGLLLLDLGMKQAG